MNVMIIARGYPTDKYKMNGIFEFDQARALSRAGVNVTYLAVDMRSIRRWRKWGIEKVIIDGIKINVLNLPCGRMSRKIRNKISIWALKKLFEKVTNIAEVPDIIHAHFIGNGYIAVQALDDVDIPIVLTEHYSSMNQEEIDPYYKKIGNFTYSKVSKVISVSESLARNIRSKFNVDAIVIPNIISLSEFEYNEDTRLKKDKFKFISVGRLHKIKNMRLLIDSFYEAFNGNENVQLNIFGDGPERGLLEKKIKKLGIESQVFINGFADRKIIAQHMSKSNCFVLASKSETFGVSFIEAMAMGLPVISTRCGGPEEFIDDENGILVPVDNKTALVESLKQMHKKCNLYDRSNISTSIKLKYNEELIAAHLIDVYREILL